MDLYGVYQIHLFRIYLYRIYFQKPFGLGWTRSRLSELPMATLDRKSNEPSFGERPKSLDHLEAHRPTPSGKNLRTDTL